MPEATLQDLFGADATQTASDIVIKKADLPMTATANNNGEQILAAMVKKASITLTTANFNTNTAQSIVIEDGYPQLVYRTNGANQETLLQVSKTFKFAQNLSTPEITPDNY